MAMETRARSAKGLGSPLADVVAQKILSPLRMTRDLRESAKLRRRNFVAERDCKQESLNDTYILPTNMSPPTKDQEQRMILIEAALKGWKGDPSTLFDVATWMPLIMNAVSGTTEARKYKNEDRRKNFARVVIEQIVSPLYQRQVANILSSNYGRNQNHDHESSRVGRNFVTLCKEYEAKMAKQRWGRAQGYESSFVDDDSSVDLENSRSSLGGFVTDDTDTRDGRVLDANELVKLTDNEEEESFCEEKENSLHESISQPPRRTSRSETIFHTTNRESRSTKLQGVKIKSRRGRNQLKQQKPHRLNIQDTINNDSSILPTSRTSTDTTPIRGTLEDEIIENETPPATPLIDSNNDGPSPEKKSRQNSEELNPVVETRRTVRRCGMTVGTSGMLERTTTGTVDEEAFGPFRRGSGRNEDEDLISKEVEVKNKDSPVDQDKENLPKSVEEIARAYPKPQSCPELTPQMFQELKEALAKPQDEKLRTAFGMTIKTEHLAIYDKPEWLEDANIDFYLELIKARNHAAGESYPKVFTFQCYFYKLLEKRGFESIKGATEDKNIFSCDLVMIPIHSNHHWVLGVVDTRKKMLTCYDSMDHNNTRHINLIKDYLLDEWARLKPGRTERRNSSRNPPFVDGFDRESIWDESGWQTHDLGANDLPQQQNGRDCGVFLLQYAEYLSRRKDFDFEQKHTAYFRKRMMYETLNQSLLIT